MSLPSPPVASVSSSTDVPKLARPLNGQNYQDWRRDLEMLLTLRDYDIHDPCPEDPVAGQRWTKAQRHMLAIIHLNCEAKQARIFRAATTGKQAWDMLASRFASSSAPNVMRLEESFGTARQGHTQSMSDWIAHMETLAEELIAVGSQVSDDRLANRILGGLDASHDSVKQALRAREGGPNLDAIKDHLLAYELDRQITNDDKPTPAPPLYSIPRPPAHNNTHYGPMATAMPVLETRGTPSVDHSAVPSIPGPFRTAYPAHRYSPYGTPGSSLFPSNAAPPQTLSCHACGKLGHTQNRCWLRFPHLKPQWVKDQEIWREARLLERLRTAPVSNPPAMAHIAVTSDIPPLPSLQPPAPTTTTTPVTSVAATPCAPPTPYAFAGPDSTVQPGDYAHAFFAIDDALSPGLTPRQHYCFSLQSQPSVRSSFRSNGQILAGDEPGKWLVDSGASSHFSPFQHLFLSLTPCQPPVRILTGNGYITSLFRGTIPLVIMVGDVVRKLNLQNVLYVPELQSKVNLFSVVVLADNNIHSNFGPHDVKFELDGQLLASGSRIGNSWWLNANIRSHHIFQSMVTTFPAPVAVSASTEGTKRNVPSPESLHTWHQRLGHINKRDILRLQDHAVGVTVGRPAIPATTASCTGCLVGKQHRVISRMPRPPQKRLARIHIDICGPMQVDGYVAQHRYNTVFVDEGTRFTHCYCTVKKDDARECTMNYITLVERETGDRVLALFSDNEPVLLQGAFQQWLRDHGIQHYTTQTYSPEMNGIGENANKQIIQRASCMMWAPRIPIGFWPEAVRCSTYLKNRSPHKALGSRTPYELWFGEVPNLSHLRIFGCRCYAHIEKKLRQKLDSHTIEGIFMGYYSTERLFAIYDLDKRVIIKKRDVTFCEHVLGHPSLVAWGLAAGTNILGLPVDDSDIHLASSDDSDADTCNIHNLGSDDALLVAMHNLTLLDQDSDHDCTPGVSPTLPDGDDCIPVKVMASEKTFTLGTTILKQQELIHLAKRSRLLPSTPLLSPTTSVSLETAYLQHYEQLRREYRIPTDLKLDPLLAAHEPDPVSWRAAMQSPNRGFWLNAAFEEIRQIVRMGTFELTPDLPLGRRALPSKWVWKTKRLIDGSIERFKARWVVRGDLQKKGIDYNETFAPVANLVTLRLLFALVAFHDLELDQLDVVSAFLNGSIDTAVFLRQPQGFTLDGHSFCLLRKSLYGLCQAARAWYTVLDHTLQALNYRRLTSDLAVWIMDGVGIDSLQFVAAHVDDMVIGGSRVFIDKTKQHLRQHFDIKDEGPAHIFIGLRITRNRDLRQLFIDQAHYARDILQTYGMAACNPCFIPMKPGDQHLPKPLPHDRLSEDDQRTYQAIIGSLGYLMNCSRPDLAFAVNKLAQFGSAAGLCHLTAAKHVLRYIQHTINSRLSVNCGFSLRGADDLKRSGDELKLSVYFDSSWADDMTDSRSTYGYCIMYGTTTIAWKSRKHRGISLSTTDAEYVAACEATRELMFVLNLFSDLRLPISQPVLLFGDNVNANSLANQTAVSSRTRHIALKERYVTEKCVDGIIHVQKVDSTLQVADIFTKPLPQDRFLSHAKSLGLFFGPTVEQVFLCHVCNSSFVSSNKLHGHIRTSHSGI